MRSLSNSSIDCSSTPAAPLLALTLNQASQTARLEITNDCAAARLEVEAERWQGNWFPHRLREAGDSATFFVGDSAGHCLPLSGEGIRTAFYFGIVCGREPDRLMTQLEITTSTERSGSGICSMSPLMNSAFATPASRRFSRARASISSVMSSP